jgi:hypothetical protein
MPDRSLLQCGHGDKECSPLVKRQSRRLSQISNGGGIFTSGSVLTLLNTNVNGSKASTSFDDTTDRPEWGASRCCPWPGSDTHVWASTHSGLSIIAPSRRAASQRRLDHLVE